MQSQSWKIPGKRKWQPITVFLPGESHGQRSLVGCSPGAWKELDMTEHLRTVHFSIWASKELLMVRNLSANAGDTRDSGLIQRVGHDWANTHTFFYIIIMWNSHLSSNIDILVSILPESWSPHFEINPHGVKYYRGYKQLYGFTYILLNKKIWC